MPLGLFQIEYQWYCVGVFLEDKRLSPFLFRDMTKVKVESVCRENDFSDFRVKNYLKDFHYDESDSFEDDRQDLEKDLSRHRDRIDDGVQIQRIRVVYK